MQNHEELVQNMKRRERFVEKREKREKIERTERQVKWERREKKVTNQNVEKGAAQQSKRFSLVAAMKMNLFYLLFFKYKKFETKQKLCNNVRASHVYPSPYCLRYR